MRVIGRRPKRKIGRERPASKVHFLPFSGSAGSDSLVLLRNRSARISPFSESLRLTHDNLPGLLCRKQR